MRVVAQPQLSDNYAWFLIDESNGDCAVVDPAEAKPVRSLLKKEGWRLRWILATHHHWDHTGGIAELAEGIPDLVVYGSQWDREQGRVPNQTHAAGDGDRITVAGATADCLVVPGHTLGAVAYHFVDTSAVFTGDTLFLAGCGRLFEGTAQQMHDSLGKLRALPAQTQVYCGHEYTAKNLHFAATVLPEDGAIAARRAEVDAQRARGEATVPAPLEIELRTNPFLRADDPDVAAVVGKNDPVDVFAELRARRDRF